MKNNSHIKKRLRTFSKTILHSYVFSGAESEFEVKIARYPISFEHNPKKNYFWVSDGTIWYDYGFQAAECNNEATD